MMMKPTTIGRQTVIVCKGDGICTLLLPHPQKEYYYYILKESITEEVVVNKNQHLDIGVVGYELRSPKQ